MNKVAFLLLGFCILSNALKAQSDKSANSMPASKAIYGELGGSGLVFSANFDSRFKGHKGLGFRAGFGFFGAASGGEADGIITIPVGINYLFGKGEGPHHFEMGLTYTYLSTASSTFGDQESTFFFHPHFGYRFTKPSNSFNGRIYIGPLIGDGFVFFPFGGLSVGYTLPNRK